MTFKTIVTKVGDMTNHHDQSITLQSFNTTNTIVSKSVNPILDLDEELLILFVFLLCIVLIVSEYSSTCLRR